MIRQKKGKFHVRVAKPRVHEIEIGYKAGKVFQFPMSGEAGKVT